MQYITSIDEDGEFTLPAVCLREVWRIVSEDLFVACPRGWQGPHLVAWPFSLVSLKKTEVSFNRR